MGSNEAYRNAAADLANFLADHEIGLVYGGANVGLMKILADVMLKRKKTVIGIMPEHLVRKEVAHVELTEMIIVDTMAQRKEKMVELSDGFVALPGGFGTFDELTEILTFNQLRLTDKPLGILNVGGYFDLMLQFYDHAVKEGFVRKAHRDNLIVSNDIELLFEKMNNYKPLTMGKWINEIKVESQKDN
jgi:uncharacterized protein (TIGR00730 family)